MSTRINNVANLAYNRPLTQPDFTIGYYVNGLTHVSNNTTLLPRDTAGNITIEPSSSNLLVIEPIVDKVTTTSVLKVIDTSFKYYKFPVATVPLRLDVDLNIADSEEILYTSLTLPISVDSKNQINDLDRISTSYDSGWFYNDAQITKGYKSLPFQGGVQPKPNSYTITKEGLDLLREKNKTLKFKIQLQFNSLTPSRTSISIKLKRTNPKFYRSFKEVILYSESNVNNNIGFAGISFNNNPYDFTSPNDYPYFFMEYYVDMTDIVEGDSYYIEAVSGGETWCLNSNGFWDIEPVDIPTQPGYYGYNSDSYKNAGVYYISPNTVLRDMDNNDIGIKNVTSNQEFKYI